MGRKDSRLWTFLSKTKLLNLLIEMICLVAEFGEL